MRKRLLTTISIITLFSTLGLMGCNDEITAGPGSSESFIKLFGSENNQIANDMSIDNDGSIVILSTSNIEEEIGFSSKIKITKLDAFGNLLWESSYPEGPFSETSTSYFASSITPNNDGYLIVGESINANNSSQLLILNVSNTGDLDNVFEYALNNGLTGLSGVDVGVNTANELKVVAQVDSTSQNIWIGSFSNDNNFTLDESCTFRYSTSGTGLELLKNMYIESDDAITYGIGIIRSGRENGSLVKVPSCQPTLITGAQAIVQQSTSDYNVNQMSNSLNGYAFVGTTNFNDDEDIFLARVDRDGVLQDQMPLIYGELEGVILDGNDEGLAIMQTGDGGFLIGGASESNSAGENDILLIKTDFRGNVNWVQRYGDENNDRPIILGQAPDGGYLVLANTDFGGIQSLLLIKTDRTGNVL